MKRSQQGFTLIELIVVLGIMGVVTTLATSVFIQMNSSWAEIRSDADFEIKANNIFDEFRRDADQAIPQSVTHVPLAVTNDQYRGASEAFFNAFFNSDTLEFPAYVPLGPQGLLRPGRVRYFLDRQSGAPSLIRQVLTLDGESVVGQQNVGTGVYGFDVQFPAADGRGWTNDWTGNRAPSFVRVSILLIDDRDATEQVARTAVIRIPS